MIYIYLFLRTSLIDLQCSAGACSAGAPNHLWKSNRRESSGFLKNTNLWLPFTTMHFLATLRILERGSYNSDSNFFRVYSMGS